MEHMDTHRRVKSALICSQLFSTKYVVQSFPVEKSKAAIAIQYLFLHSPFSNRIYQHFFTTDYIFLQLYFPAFLAVKYRQSHDSAGNLRMSTVICPGLCSTWEQARRRLVTRGAGTQRQGGLPQDQSLMWQDRWTGKKTECKATRQKEVGPLSDSMKQSLCKLWPVFRLWHAKERIPNLLGHLNNGWSYILIHTLHLSLQYTLNVFFYHMSTQYQTLPQFDQLYTVHLCGLVGHLCCFDISLHMHHCKLIFLHITMDMFQIFSWDTFMKAALLCP